MGWLIRTWSCCQLVCLQIFFLYSLAYAKLCSDDEASALLQFKQLFTYSTNDAYSNFCHGTGRNPIVLTMEYWKEDTDCCKWGGVTCDKGGMGHVTGLDLSCNQLNGTVPSNTTLFHLPYLRVLRLFGNYHLRGSFPEANWSNPLEILDVSLTSFSVRLSDTIGNLRSLRYLGLSFCKFVGSVPASLGNLTQLADLYLSDNNFSGNIPSSLSNLQHLNSLDLSNNNFNGEIPDIFVNLTQLSYLDLSRNQLSGPIPSCLSGLTTLEYMELYDNSLSGTIPSSLFGLPLLREIDLRFNQLVAIDIGENPSSNSLRFITLNNNRLHGSIPSSFFQLAKLEEISLSSNNLSGILEPCLLAKLTNLTSLDLSINSLSLSSSTIKLNSSFEALNNLEHLDLSHNKIHGKIPDWMWGLGKDTLNFLNLSHNSLAGGIEQLPWKNLRYLDLRSNLLRGQLPVPPPALVVFTISNNQLTGEISHWICNMSDLAVLDLSDNNMSGTIPECIRNMSSDLRVLDLKNNSFSGTIPEAFAESNSLETLNFNGNDFEGPVPRSLVQVLDLGNNKMQDTFPHWLEILQGLQVLVLRSNRFYGSVRDSKAKNSFSKLRILDLSNNNFSGSLPRRYFKNLKAMMNVGNVGRELQYMDMGVAYYQYSVTVTMKGVDIEMEKILTIFTTMDLSSNKFRGRIPDVVGEMKSLKVVNFSHNNLIGPIPLFLENLTEMESLDLSSNKLEGSIPNQLTSLTFLSTLNLSYNRLVGSIPQGNQFGTFQNDSYIGNPGLCGFPLSEKCSNGEAPDYEPAEPEPTVFHASWFDWKISLMGYGCGVVIGLSMGYIVFATGKPEWVVRIVEGKKSGKMGRLTGRRRRTRN